RLPNIYRCSGWIYSMIQYPSRPSISLPRASWCLDKKAPDSPKKFTRLPTPHYRSPSTDQPALLTQAVPLVLPCTPGSDTTAVAFARLTTVLSFISKELSWHLPHQTSTPR